MSKVVHYRDNCIGCGACYELQPERWRMSNRDGKATLLQAEIKKNVHILTIDDIQIPKTKEVVTACPVNIIQLL